MPGVQPKLKPKPKLKLQLKLLTKGQSVLKLLHALGRKTPLPAWAVLVREQPCEDGTCRAAPRTRRRSNEPNRTELAGSYYGSSRGVGLVGRPLLCFLATNNWGGGPAW